MKIVNVVIMLTLGLSFVLFSSPPSNAIKGSEDITQYAQMWDYALKNGDHWGVFTSFKAIQLKNETRFEPALKEFIKLKYQKPSAHMALAIYTLAKLGNADAEQEFNKFLATDFHSKAKSASMIPTQEKRESLEYMLELGMKPSPDAVEQIKKEIAMLINSNLPALTLNLVVPMKKSGYEISKEQKTKLTELITNKWRNVRAEDLLISGLQPDWETIWKSKDAKIMGNELAKMFLLVADEKSRQEILKLTLEPPMADNFLKQAKPLIEASLGDKNAIKTLQDKMTADQLNICNYAPDKLPDEIILKAVQVGSEKLNIIPESRLISELERRGHKEILRKYMERAEILSSVDSQHSKVTEEKLRAMWALSQYDPSKALTVLSKMLEKSPNDFYIAQGIVEFPVMSHIKLHASGWEKWIKDNPETLARAIKTMIEASNKPEGLVQSIDALAPTSEAQIYHEKNTAFSAMLYLPDDVFNKYFAKINPKYLTPAAYLPGVYFNAKWLAEPNQESFYNKYKREFGKTSQN